MTLDDAITHCHEVAAAAGASCGLEHKQLGEWLEELQRMRTKFSIRKNVEGLETHEEPKCGQALLWACPEEIIKREVINK